LRSSSLKSQKKPGLARAFENLRCTQLPSHPALRATSLWQSSPEQKTVVRYETVEERRRWSQNLSQEQKKQEELRAALRERGIDPDILEADPEVIAAMGLKFLQYKKPDPVQ
jgi:hypothetical protein